MYFEDLSRLQNEFDLKTLEIFDKSLAFLPKSYRDKILPENLRKVGIGYDTAKKLLIKSSEVGLLKQSCMLCCPNCNFTLRISSFKDIIDDVEDISFCDWCDSEDIEITTDNIRPIYELVKEPKNR